MRAVTALIVATMLVMVSAPARAQAERQRPFAWDVARAVLIDPTTFAPALISYEATQQDWKTSQIFFANGWLEQNALFTVSGRPNDRPVAYGEGVRRIRSEALTVLAYSAFNNAGAGVLERLFVERYPKRKRLIRTLSWVERIAFASVLTYRASAHHFRQASNNRRLAREYRYTYP